MSDEESLSSPNIGPRDHGSIDHGSIPLGDAGAVDSASEKEMLAQLAALMQGSGADAPEIEESIAEESESQIGPPGSGSDVDPDDAPPPPMSDSSDDDDVVNVAGDGADEEDDEDEDEEKDDRPDKFEVLIKLGSKWLGDMKILKVWTVKELKERIAKKFEEDLDGVNIQTTLLTVKGSGMEEEESIADHPEILNGSILSFNLPKSESESQSDEAKKQEELQKMLSITVKAQSRQATFTISGADTIGDLKDLLEKSLELDSESVKLLWQGRVLRNDLDTVAQCKISNGGMILAMRSHVGGASVLTIKTLSSGTFDVDVKMTDPLYRLRGAIWSKAEIPFDKQKFVYKGQILEPSDDDVALGDLGLSFGDTVHVIDRFEEKSDELVNFAVYSVPSVRVGCEFEIQVWASLGMHMKSLQIEDEKFGEDGAIQGESKEDSSDINRGNQYIIKLRLPDDVIAEADTDVVLWKGNPVSVKFKAKVGALPPGKKMCYARIINEGVTICNLNFGIRIKPANAVMRQKLDLEERVRKTSFKRKNAFVVYAKEDEPNFIDWSEKCMSNEYFAELSPFPGFSQEDDDNPKFWREFHAVVLFWSPSAKNDKAVEAAWRSACRHQKKHALGSNFIHVIMLDMTCSVPPLLSWSAFASEPRLPQFLVEFSDDAHSVNEDNEDSHEQKPIPADGNKDDDGAVPILPVIIDAMKFNALKIGPKLGEGNFGVVHQGLWRDSVVAVKRISTKGVSARLVQETLRGIAGFEHLPPHANIVQTCGGTLFGREMIIVSEYMSIGSLKQVISNRVFFDSIPFAMKVKLAMDVCDGLYHIHRQGLIHRNLHTGNILINEHYMVKIADGGTPGGLIQKYIKEMDTSVITPPIRILSPETIYNDEFTIRTDIYAFGVFLYEIFTGTEPYEGLNAVEVKSRVVSGVANIADTLPEYQDIASAEFVSLISDCTRRNPARRPPVDEVLARLLQTLDHLPSLGTLELPNLSKMGLYDDGEPVVPGDDGEEPGLIDDTNAEPGTKEPGFDKLPDPDPEGGVSVDDDLVAAVEEEDVISVGDPASSRDPSRPPSRQPSNAKSRENSVGSSLPDAIAAPAPSAALQNEEGVGAQPVTESTENVLRQQCRACMPAGTCVLL